MNVEELEVGGTGQQTWRIGDLAAVSGVSVRALHHYDQLGLLRASRRSAAGHRLYLAADVRRLHRILAIRGFGLSLAEIGQVLDGEVPDARGLIQQQLRQVEEQITAATALRKQLKRILDGLDSVQEPSPRTLLELMEVMKMNRQLTTEEFDEMQQQRQRWADSMTPEEHAEANASRAEAIAHLSDAEQEQMRAHRSQLRPDGR
ncbi:MerR family transcriptional regulator [Paramicrobacterium chengjingii]|uniref:MerR family transcriptional regulator n=1 Tax=Paramicrobacterium chengjingii TaxID=2769067 RepID=UPI00142212C9|nr:MerR family transcriptional regulator [Microbacterium chengjingii]